MKNDVVLDALSEAIEATINQFINKDVYYFIAPYLSSNQVNSDCPFFEDNRITLTEGKGVIYGGFFPDTTLYPDIHLYPSKFDESDATYSDVSGDLKTVSYLAPFQRARVAYNPKFIDHYLRTLGHIGYDESVMDILCYQKGKCGSDKDNLTYTEWEALP